MNIMFIIPSLGGGGAERVMATLASSFSKKHRVFVVAYTNSGVSYRIDDTVKVISLGIKGGKSKLKKIANSIQRILMLRKLKRELKIDIAISMLYSPNFENVISHYNEKTILSIRNKASKQLVGLPAKLNTFACRHADITVTLSKNVMMDQIKKFNVPERKLRTIYNPCDINMISQLSIEGVVCSEFENIRKEAECIVITAGRLIQQKGQWHLIRAFSEVVKENPKAVLVILGQGELEQYLRDLIKGFKLEKNIYLLGFYSNPYPYLAQSDVFVFTSLFEGFGNILLEAMACSLPVISCDCDAGPRELLAPQTNPMNFTDELEFSEYGILTPVMDGVHYGPTEPLIKQEQILAKAIIQLICDKELMRHYSEKSKIRIKDFSLNHIVSQWEEVFQ